MKNVNMEMSFSTLMAASIHDIKNILGTVLQSNDWLFQHIKDLDEESKEELQKISQLIAHVNSELMQLLCFFKVEKNQFSMQIKENDVEEFLRIQAGFIQSLIFKEQIHVEIDCEDDLIAFFDETLIASAVRNAAMNSLKFAKSKIVFRAENEGDFLKISVEDDGEGFPDDMLGVVENRAGEVDFTSGSTGLGLYFAELVAKLHESKKHTGYIELGKSKKHGGASFNIYVP